MTTLGLGSVISEVVNFEMVWAHDYPQRIVVE